MHHIYNPQGKVAQLYRQALGAILVASYNLRGLQWDYSFPQLPQGELCNHWFTILLMFRYKKCGDQSHFSAEGQIRSLDQDILCGREVRYGAVFIVTVVNSELQVLEFL